MKSRKAETNQLSFNTILKYPNKKLSSAWRAQLEHKSITKPTPTSVRLSKQYLYASPKGWKKAKKDARTDKIADWPSFLHFFPLWQSLENSVKLLKSTNSRLVFYIIRKWSYHQNEVYPLIFVTAHIQTRKTKYHSSIHEFQVTE